ncbi:MAG: FixH family protein [Myxococcales bacterium]|nr:FixH family protein [Myxococcales bacterium]
MKACIGRMGVLVAALALTFACIGCGNDEEAREPSEVFVTSKAALYEGVFASQPTVGHNMVQLRLTRADGSPVQGALLAGEALCPEHGHGSSDTPIISEVSAGDYVIDNVVFQMAGPWDVHVYVSAPGGQDELVVHYDVD